LGLFVSYCLAFVLFLTLFLKWWYTKVLQTIFIGALFFLAISYGWYLLGIDTLILYYLVSAYAEEYLKYSSSNNVFSREESHNLRDLIFFCILIGLWFSMVENLLYLGYSFINHEQVSLVNMTLGRGLISTLLHVVSTSLIAFLAVKIQKKRNFGFALIGWIIWGVGIHSLYNISLAYHLQYITIPIIIICFFLLSYLLYQSDMLYEKG
jgi:RsiW-degrading membrane proteinase PrsW (M82 family)